MFSLERIKRKVNLKIEKCQPSLSEFKSTDPDRLYTKTAEKLRCHGKTTLTFDMQPWKMGNLPEDQG